MEPAEKKEIVSDENSYELGLFIELLHKKYPSLSYEKIQDAVDKCMLQIRSSSLRDELIVCLRQKLEMSDKAPGIGDNW